MNLVYLLFFDETTPNCSKARVSRGTLEERSSTATPLVATHQDVSLGPIIGGVLYNWRYGYAYISVSRSSVTSPIMANTTCRKTLCSQTFGKPYLIVLYMETPCNLHLRETLCNRIILGKPIYSPPGCEKERSRTACIRVPIPPTI